LKVVVANLIIAGYVIVAFLEMADDDKAEKEREQAKEAKKDK
jgi:hypothetical protein